MKTVHIICLLSVTLFLASCESSGAEADFGTTVVSGVTKQLNLGPEGGCYYVNDNGNKSYVDRSECRC